MEKKLKKLKNALGDKINDSIVERKLYSYDATAIPIEHITPIAVAFPTSSEDIETIVKICYEEDIPIVPRGAGSGLTGGATPVVEGSIVISLEKMNKFYVDVDNTTAYVEPGVVTSELQDYVESLGLFYPPDPSSFKYSTIGGNIAENAGGPRCLKYGVTREYVLGLEMYIKEGKLLKTGNPIIKDVAGYDLTRLVVGSEGTLGIVSKAILKLIPKPPYKSTIMGIFNNIENIGKSVTKILTSGILPCALEFMDKNSIQAVQKFYPAGIPEDAEGVLLIELDGQKESVEKEKMEVSNILKSLGADVIPAQNPQHEQKLWSARKNIGPALANIKSGKINEDIVFPRIYLSEALQKINEIAKKYNLTIVNFGHIGDGNLHVNILYDKLNKEELARAEKAVDEVFELALHYQGSITGEHGVGLTKKKFLELQLKDVGIELLKAIKQSFDPKNLFNPGKVI